MSQQNPQENMVTVLTRELEALKVQYEMVREQNHTISRDNHTLVSQNETLNHDLEQLKFRSVAHLNSSAFVEQERDRLVIKNQNLRADLERVCRGGQELERKYLELNDAVAQERKAHKLKEDELQKKISELERNLIIPRIDLDELASKLEILERENSGLTSQLNAEKAMVELMSKENTEAEEKMKAKVDQLENEIESLKQKLRAKENLITRIQNVCKAPASSAYSGHDETAIKRGSTPTQ